MSKLAAYNSFGRYPVTLQKELGIHAFVQHMRQEVLAAHAATPAGHHGHHGQHTRGGKVHPAPDAQHEPLVVPGHGEPLAETKDPSPLVSVTGSDH